MNITKSLDVNEDLQWINNKIENWVNNENEGVLSIVSVPYNSCFIFLNLMLDYINTNKRILYITNEKQGYINIINLIKKYSDVKSYSYAKKNNYDDKAKLIICNHDNAFNIKEHFDLVIYDDISSFSNYSKKDIERLLICRTTCKIITYSIEPIFDNGTVIEIPIKTKNLPIAEPRIINTRIDITKDIPYVLYEYISWFTKNKKKILIYTPDKDRSIKVFEYMDNIKDRLECNIFYLNKDRKRIENYVKVKDVPIIVIAEGIEQIDMSYDNLNIILYFTDDTYYDYKKIVYFCGKVGVNLNYSAGEILLLSKDVTEDMEKAKTITRNFNKWAWERGLLNI